jgi:3-hydroxymyristoyl/3-hydroxydecanoyl-(acyl carrier protein) dehydratase
VQPEALVRAFRKKPLWAPRPDTDHVQLERADVERLLPHRAPFLFVDSIDALDLEQSAIRGRRTIGPDDPVFVGHFPGQPIYPGVLQIETMGQLGVCLAALLRKRQTPVNVRALKIHHALFQREVLPGDSLSILARMLESDDYTAVCAGQLLKPDGSVSALAVMEVYFLD